uniref:CSON003529 protein n=1 Tax=Culicoides sonorensis TaxID=179676 RepID=A0A336MNM8_CULSO
MKYDLHLDGIVVSNIDCTQNVNQVFLDLLIKDINLGCAVFIVTFVCAEIFLESYRKTHMDATARYLRKYLILIQDQEFFDNDIEEYFKNVIISEDLPQTIVISLDSDEVVSISYNQNMKDQFNQYFIHNESFLYEKKFFTELTNLTGIELKVATINYPPYTHYEFVPPGTGNANLENSDDELSVSLDGVELYLCLEFCKKYNCTITLHTEEEELWGDITKNGSSTGLMHAIVTGQSDVTIAAFYHWGNLFPFMQFSDSIQKVRVMHLVPKPKPLPYFLTPLMPFNYTVWISMIVVYFVSILLIQLTSTIMAYTGKKSTHEFGSVVMTILKLSLFEGTSVIKTTSLAEFIIFGFLFYFAMIVGNLYGGALASVMTITKFENPISTISDIIHSDLIWGGPSLVFVLSVIDSQEPDLRYYLDHFKEMSMKELNEHGKAQDMAIILEALQFGTVCIAEYMDEEIAKNYMLTSDDMYWEQTVMPSRKTWPYMELMNKIILMQAESGIASYWEYKATVKTMNYKIQKTIEENKKTLAGNDNPIQLSVDHIIGANYLILIGSVLSCIAFVGELLWYHKFRHIFERKAIARPKVKFIVVKNKNKMN